MKSFPPRFCLHGKGLERTEGVQNSGNTTRMIAHGSEPSALNTLLQLNNEKSSQHNLPCGCYWFFNSIFLHRFYYRNLKDKDHYDDTDISNLKRVDSGLGSGLFRPFLCLNTELFSSCSSFLNSPSSKYFFWSPKFCARPVEARRSRYIPVEAPPRIGKVLTPTIRIKRIIFYQRGSGGTTHLPSLQLTFFFFLKGHGSEIFLSLILLCVMSLIRYSKFERSSTSHFYGHELLAHSPTALSEFKPRISR